MAIIIVHGVKSDEKNRRPQEYLDYFKCNRIVEEWDGISKLSNGDLAFTCWPRIKNNPQFGYPSANIYHVDKAKSLVTQH